MNGSNVLLVDDDTKLKELLESHPSFYGIRFDAAHDGEAALELVRHRNYTSIILDLNLPKIDGFEVCRTLRVEQPQLGIIVLSCRTDESDRVLALELGADDYISKPAGIREIAARLRAVIRRVRSTRSESDPVPIDKIKVKDLVIRPGERTVHVRGSEVHFTAREFDLLYYLAKRPGVVHSKEEILTEVWGYQSLVYEPLITSFICRVRRKIEHDSGNPEYIKTVRGAGYKLSGASPRASIETEDEQMAANSG